MDFVALIRYLLTMSTSHVWDYLWNVRIEHCIFRWDFGARKNINKYWKRERKILFLFHCSIEMCTQFDTEIVYKFFSSLFWCKKSSVYVQNTIYCVICKWNDLLFQATNAVKYTQHVHVWMLMCDSGTSTYLYGFQMKYTEMILKMYILLALSYFRTCLSSPFVLSFYVRNFFFVITFFEFIFCRRRRCCNCIINRQITVELASPFTCNVCDLRCAI